MTRRQKNDILQGTLALLVLKTLAACGAMHGYAITAHIQLASSDLLRVEEGSLYPALHRMEQDGWVRAEWGMTAPTVNAYYDAQMNDVNFPAGVLMPPLYDPKMDDAPNYGDTAGTIGHELTHAFDDQGRQFDGDGNLRNWWAERDAANFENRAQCIRNQYSQYVIVDDIKINGALTSGEDIADLGGELIAWMAWQEQTRSMQLATADDLSPQQRFFVGFAQWACANERPETLRVNAIVDPHSPPRDRINGVVTNMPEFAQAFHCKPGQALVKPPEKMCKIW